MKGVPLGADGKHTFVPYAATSAAIASARDSAFSSYIVLAETKATIVDGSTIKVTVPWNAAETALTFDPDECNYLRYKNDPIDNNYRYCFITNCEYVNPNTFLFTLKEDYFTTWAPYANIKECFVKRQHSPTDSVGDNVIPESFDLGKLVFETPKQALDYSIYPNCIVVLCAFTMDDNANKFTDATGSMYGGMYSGVNMYGFYYARIVAMKLMGSLMRAVPMLTLAAFLPKGWGISLPASLPGSRPRTPRQTHRWQ